MFSDESQFSETSDSGYQLLQKEEEHIMHHSMFMDVIGMDEESQCGQVLCTMAEHVFSSLRKAPLYHSGIAIGPAFLFMDDNAWPHRTAEVSHTLESENIECTEWPAYPLDLNPVEHALDALDRCVSHRTYPP